MSLFNTILEKLGIRKDKPAPTPVAVAKPAAGADKGEKDNLVRGAKPATINVSAKAIPIPVSDVDVVKKLEQLSGGSGLDWKVSIVDLLKLLDIDSSREARNELAKELGCPADLMSDSAKMNVWLHKTVLRKIAENGGNVPPALFN
jgi:hypothetical protein